MTTVAMAPAEARKRVESTIEELRASVVHYLGEHGDVVSLRELLQFLRSRGHADELVSRALAGMLSAGDLLLTADRRVILPSSR
jgi:DNA-binding transcriptional regulator PaaX